ncbi:MAG: dTMP kinase [Syntrophobacteraceae bacterium]|nr:dTMP kinase [Syntrophobacteraceae bacterium]
MNESRGLLPRAKFVSFEGIDGCGKSTLLDRLASELTERSIAYVRVREPGGTSIGEKVRQILLDPACSEMTGRAEVLLYSASRAQLISQVIAPAMEKGVWVLADRFVDATFAYQGFGRGFELERLKEIQKWATGGLIPDKTVLLDCDVELALARLGRRQGSNRDRIELEGEAFQRRVRNGYLALAGEEPERFLILDASRPLEEVAQQLRAQFWPQNP